ncbi:16S rRNA (uracil(1498)-N(3))-methyltransferase [Pedobacter sp. SD-b]|uniref:Ribosomal RNA small subunit methyltransferase E n=1 Tax=Pedobacter segetis TaxID=2793069 RepID=A0ABS1BHD1_9SPHI|nr:16S rRNA (uracil(1498)-N(3))-methyltransferase [Pedobacter segetis]MBK0382270.1 16S rRNA (uracil(1498)-N(3))-methyltransferase [Pedobacter segetis]
MHLFYTPDIQDQTYQLDEEESKHCIKVLRLKIGDQINLIDGKGGLYLAEIIDDHPKRTVLNILQIKTEYAKRNHYLHIAVAPTKNIDRFEWFLEKATEIGIDEVTPIICERSERKEIKIDRSNKIITSAIKQSLKAYHPKLNNYIPFKTFISQASADLKLIAHCDEGQKPGIAEKFIPHQKYLILIGPEGDFSPTEIAAALESGFIAITLGDSRLRTETAALEACFEINYLNRE